MTLSWDARAGVSKYRLEWRIGGSADWTEVEAEVVGTSHAMAGLNCGTEYRFKLSAYGDGKVYRDTWSDTVKITGVDTDACALPSRMSAPTVEADGDGLIVTWSAPSDDGGAPVTRYQVRYGRVGEPGRDPARWNRVSMTAPATSTTIAGPRAGTTYAVQVRAKNRAGWSAWSESGTGPTATPAPPAPPTVGVSAQALFVGQTVTLTATATSTVTWQWQEWTSGKWTNVAGATSARHTAKSTTAVVRTFRVVAANGAGAAESEPVVVGWRPMTVVVTASDDSPATGTPVILTATADAPSSGVTYQWQQGSDDTWTNKEAASTSNTLTVDSASDTTRGARKYRVVVKHTPTDGTAMSEPIDVIWGEWSILSDLVVDLSAAVATSTTYGGAETALLTCMNAGVTNSTSTFVSFSDILTRYDSTTKAKMESSAVDECQSKADTMFSVNRTVTLDELGTLSDANADYGALLNTDRWDDLGDSVSDPAILKATAHLAQSGLASGERSLAEPYYQPSGHFVGQDEHPIPPNFNPRMTSGYGCLPEKADGSRLTLRNKLEVLTCLAVYTPPQFWFDQAKDDGTVKLNNHPRFKTWLGFENWDCTRSPDVPLYACLKHDTVWDSLRKFVSDPPGESDRLDEAWNPRNKNLADQIFLKDLQNFPCKKPETQEYLIHKKYKECLDNVSKRASVYFRAVADRNDKGWPVTSEDVADGKRRPWFISCRSPQFPSVTSPEGSSVNKVLTVEFDLEPGCVVGAEGVEVELIQVFSQVTNKVFVGLWDSSLIDAPCSAESTRVVCKDDYRHLSGPGYTADSVEIEVTPRNPEWYGADTYYRARLEMDRVEL